MDLYAFGFNGHGQISDLLTSAFEASTDNILTLRKVLHGQFIEIVFASWCDAVSECIPSYVHFVRRRRLHLTDGIVHFESSTCPETNIAPQLTYTGSGLTILQREALKTLASKSKAAPKFFGSQLGDGLKGLIFGNGSREAVFFASTSEIQSGATEYQLKSLPQNSQFHGISMTSGCHVEVFTQGLTSSLTAPQLPKEVTTKSGQPSQILHFGSVDAFRSWLDSPCAQQTQTLQSLLQLVSNATTTTSLLLSGKVYTHTRDPRFPRLLGRSYDDNSSAPSYTASPISYLSETSICKIASGGYMTAAISGEGELFLWGQAFPGVEFEITVLKTKHAETDNVCGVVEDKEDELSVPEPEKDLGLLPPSSPVLRRPETVHRWAKEVVIMQKDGTLPLHSGDPHQMREYIADNFDEGDDEFIKVVEILIDGKEARVTDVAIGSGHILVAAERDEGNVVLSAVFAAGQNESGQLGLGRSEAFVEDFVEIKELRGKKVKQLVAAGWTSWVVTEGE